MIRLSVILVIHDELWRNGSNKQVNDEHLNRDPSVNCSLFALLVLYRVSGI